MGHYKRGAHGPFLILMVPCRCMSQTVPRLLGRPHLAQTPGIAVAPHSSPRAWQSALRPVPTYKLLVARAASGL